MEIPVGTTHQESVIVDKTNVASAVGSGLVDVFATPMMVALLELASARCVESYLDDGMVTVGTHVDVEHSGATPIGMKVTAIASVSAFDRRRIDFDIVVMDEVTEVGRGKHTRFAVDKAKFTEKALSKGK
ncbi:MAG: thioesterase family protein [Parabacteroides sp.]|nr:thioesterase family protein [Parabacteroides sp.]